MGERAEAIDRLAPSAYVRVDVLLESAGYGPARSTPAATSVRDAEAEV